MCGIAGFFGTTLTTERGHEVLTQMAGQLAHRGPDDQGIWLDPQHKIGFAHRRLAIQDLSSKGKQPMSSESGRYKICYNGEIYNFKELRCVLANLHYRFRGTSDTEVLLAAIEEWGVAQALCRCIGMFAFALWDKYDNTLTLARDRFGEKPLYFGWQSTSFIFSSELRALQAHPDFEWRIDQDSLELLLKYSSISAPFSIYKNIKKVLPGTFIVVKNGTRELQTEEYWSLLKVANKGLKEPFLGSEDQAVQTLEKKLCDAVSLQMISDVPVGAFLSGGIDSSTIVAVMQKLSDTSINTYSIGFEEENYNEADHAKEIAKYLGTSHTEFYIQPKHALEVIPDIPTYFDEPFSDSSQIPTYLISKLARQDVTVALTGDGGDELFGGYNRHFLIRSVWQKLRMLPLPIRQLIGNIIHDIGVNKWDSLAKILQILRFSTLNISQPGEKLLKLGNIIDSKNPEELYEKLVSNWTRPSSVIIGASNQAKSVIELHTAQGFNSIENQMMFADTMHYLPNDILTKVDRTSMAVSLETRLPMLDHRICEFAWSLPLEMKVSGGTGKKILKKLLKRHVPEKLFERPKMGFAMPIDSWLRGPLKEWSASLLDRTRLKNEGYFEPEFIRKAWHEHQSGHRNLQHQLWDILMFQSWLESQKNLRKSIKMDIT